MGELVNLRRARKARERAATAEAAARNRASFGRSKAERMTSAGEAERRDAALDSHRLERPDTCPGDTTGE